MARSRRTPAQMLLAAKTRARITFALLLARAASGERVDALKLQGLLSDVSDRAAAMSAKERSSEWNTTMRKATEIGATRRRA